MKYRSQAWWTWTTRTALAVIACTLCVPAAAQDAKRVSRAQLAQSLFAIEQIEEEYRVQDNIEVLQRPDSQAQGVEKLAGGSVVLVTGHVTGTNWYRVWTDNGTVGYVAGDWIRPLNGEPQPEPVMAAVAVAPQPAKRPEPAPASRSRQVASLTVAPAEGVFRDCEGCPQMVAVGAGSFTMGSPGGDSSEQPPHGVKIGYRFALGRFEVTVSEWMACVRDGGCSYQPKRVERPEETPVRNVSWGDATQFVDWLSRKTGKKYRLPSEAEWEYAARAGSDTAYWWGDEMADGNADCKDCGGTWNRKQPSLIGRHRANPFGLYDMNGGVAEWTADCWFSSHRGAPGDGSARDKRDCQQRVLRGGSWRHESAYLRSHARLFYDALVNYGANGLRVALSLE